MNVWNRCWDRVDINSTTWAKKRRFLTSWWEEETLERQKAEVHYRGIADEKKEIFLTSSGWSRGGKGWCQSRQL